MALESGPYVQAACICDMVLEDKSGVLSLIRIIDVLTHAEASPEAPEEMPAFTHTMTLVVMLKSGTARGRAQVIVRPELPTGEMREPLGFTVHFDGEERGQNLILRLSYQFTLEGLYWFDILLDDQKLTAIPLRVKYNRIITGSAPQAPAP